MANRLDLQDLLENLLGSPNVYFDPPETIKMKYPGIRYKLSECKSLYANDAFYHAQPGYEVILIDKDSDSKYVNKLLLVQYSRFVRYYTANGLHHWVFNLYN